MGASLGSGGGPMADINVTPLIDVVLVLLVVFMVITPMMESGLSVDLPQATQTKKMQDKGQFVVVGISAEKGLWVDDDEVTEETLVDVVNSRFASKTDLEGVLIKADHDLQYGEVRKYMDILGQANMTTLLVAANKKD
ncbi:MAG: biopolymer transporter ExbD [Proteobacteria bacterium]|nr:biopolymer transporter ExbD [Pseudomonadota bacterium]